MLISALFGARLPAFPTAHDAKIAKLVLIGLKQGNFLRSICREKQRQLTMSR